MASKKRQSVVAAPKIQPRATYCSAYEESVRVEGFDGTPAAPGKPVEEIKKARYWFKYNGFIRTIVLLRWVFFNFRMEVKAEDEKNSATVKTWYRENRRRCQRYARDAWVEWLKVDNIIVLWRKGKTIINPIVLRPEDVDFKDDFGIEQITIIHGLTSEAIDAMKGLTKAEKDRLKLSSKLKLTHGDPLFEFEVLKRESVGQGLASPGVVTVFHAAAQTESMEVRDETLAGSSRCVIEHHKIGHEIRSGNHAGSRAHFMKAEDAKNVEKALKGKIGFVRMATNFDHDVNYPGPDPKQYDAKKYEGPQKRFAWWAMPLAQMILERALNPYLMDALKQQAEGEREWMEPHLVKVFTAMGAPAAIKITWSNRCFKDGRLAADLLKYGLQWGPLSQQTFMEEAGYDPETERERKTVEASLPKEKTNPLVDANHGDQKTGGRGRGTADGQGKK